MTPFLAGWEVFVAGGMLYAAVAAAAGFLILRLLHPQRQRAVPWSGPEVAAVVFLVMLFWPQFLVLLLANTPLGAWLCDPGMVAAVLNNNPTPDQQLDRYRFFLRAQLLAFPFQALTAPLLLGRVSGTQSFQLGLTWHRAGRSLLLGMLVLVVVGPISLGVFHLAEWAFSQLAPGAVTPHPLSRLGEEGNTLDLVLIGLVALIAAPALEEIVFRGVLQPWLARREWGGHLAMGLSLLVVVISNPGEKLDRLLNGSPAERVRVLAPPAFVLVMALGYVWVYLKQRTPLPSALYGTSLLFAMIHAEVWPSPVGLFPLALGLGWLAWRTQSLVGPIAAHCLFNAVAFWQLLQMGK